jgi:hypothetical protein
MVEMKRAIVFLMLLVPLMLIVTGVADANFAPDQEVHIQAPGGLIFSGNQSRDIPLWIVASVPVGATPIIALAYSIDDGPNITLP